MMKNLLDELPDPLDKEKIKNYQIRIFWGLLGSALLYALTNSYIIFIAVIGILFAIKKYLEIFSKSSLRLKLDTIICFIVGMILHFMIK